MKRSVWAMLALAGLAAAAALGAQGGVPTHKTADFAQLPLVEQPSLSPNGKLMAARVAIAGVQYFAILSPDGGPPRLVALGDTDLNWWRWVNDDWLVIGVGQTTKVQGEDWYVSRALGVPADAKKIVRLAPIDAAQNADDVIWIAHDGSPHVLLSYQTSIYSNEPGFWPRVDDFDVSTGRRRAVQDPQQGVMNWYADGAGTVRIGVGHDDDGRSTRVLYRAAAGRSLHLIDHARGPDQSVVSPALFLPDGQHALTIADDDKGLGTLYTLDLTTLKRGDAVFASKGYDIAGLVVGGGGDTLLGVETNEETTGVHWTDPDLAALQVEAAARIKGAAVRIVSFSRDHQRAILNAGAPDAPGLLLLYDRKSGTMDQIAYANDAFKAHRLHPVRTIHYAARDGLDMAAILTLPKGRQTNLPLIVLPHGGPFARDTEGWDWWVQFLADRGYAVIQPNYRGSSGYGTPFSKKGEGQWGLAMQDDLDDAVAHLAAKGIADPKRVCMAGASYGGYAAERAAERDGARYRCAISYAGVSDLNGMIRYDSRFLMAGAGKDWMRKQAPDLTAVSPLAHPERFPTPILIVHGVKDRVVPVRQSRLLVQALKKAGKPVDYLEQPLADHHFTRAEDRQSFLDAMAAFLAKYNPA